MGNGVTDGSLILIGIFLFCGIAGTDGFEKTISVSVGQTREVKVAELILLVILISQIFAVLYK